MKRVMLSLVFVLFAAFASAQVATPINHFGWTEVGQAPAVAGPATYNLYVDATPAPIVLTGVVCVAAGADSACTANIPALTVGPHTVTLTQAITGAESGKSSPVSFTFVIVVTPTGFTLKP